MIAALAVVCGAQVILVLLQFVNHILGFWVLLLCNLLTSVIFYVWCYLLTSCFSRVGLNCCKHCYNNYILFYVITVSCIRLFAGFVCYSICGFSFWGGGGCFVGFCFCFFCFFVFGCFLFFCFASLPWFPKYDAPPPLSIMHVICQHHTSINTYPTNDVGFILSKQ